MMPTSISLSNRTITRRAPIIPRQLRSIPRVTKRRNMKTQILMKIPMIIKNKKRNPTKRKRGNPSIRHTTMMIAKAEVTTISKLRKRRETTAVKNEDQNMRSTTAQRKKKSIMMTVIRNMMTVIRNMETVIRNMETSK